MSSANSIVVNCGATHVSVSVFSAGDGHLKLEKFLVQPLSYDYANEAAWLDVLTGALRGIVRRMGLSGPATVIVPGYQLLTKNIKVPQVEKSRQRQIIAFEAQNSLPNASEMVWDSQIISTDGVEAEVALFAHRSSDAVRFTEAVRSTGLKPEIVDAATLLDYQAYLLSQRTIEEEVLLVNIGARSTNLTFVSSSGFSIQNISLGGNFLTQTLADNLGQTFRVAEELKLQYFSGQKHANPGDPLADTLRTNAQTFARRLGQDISRRIVNYKRQNAGRVPVRLLLTGRASLLPGLSEHLCDILKISVDYFDPTGTLRIGSHVHPELLDAFRFQMSETVGGAARLVLPEPVGVNLLPKAVAEAMEFTKKKPVLLLAAFLLAVAPWPVAVHFLKTNKELSGRIKAVKAEGDKYIENRNTLESVTTDVQKTAAHVAALAHVAAARENWRFFLFELQNTLIENTRHAWIESLVVTRPAPKPPARAADGKPAVSPAPNTPAAPGNAPAVSVSITVRVLMDKIAPGATYNADAVNQKFKEIQDSLQSRSTFLDEDKEGRKRIEAHAAAGTDGANLPKRTFILTINPANPL
ncbi:MAG: pilus assembly protein PilM [Puniceicoccales bacterium]|jgi:type IV pilus assembly protein PilM|nr:pilus assembly protein PilM [Puniceicoccales bacterium]